MSVVKNLVEKKSVNMLSFIIFNVFQITDNLSVVSLETVATTDFKRKDL